MGNAMISSESQIKKEKNEYQVNKPSMNTNQALTQSFRN